jgi:hypothetical protein
MIMAQESMQGKKPVRNPKAAFDAARRDRKREESRRAIKDPGVADRPVVEKGRGRAPKSTKPRRIIRMPPVIVRMERRPEKNGLKLARWAREAAKVPSRPYVKTRPRWKDRWWARPLHQREVISGALGSPGFPIWREYAMTMGPHIPRQWRLPTKPITREARRSNIEIHGTRIHQLRIYCNTA